MKGRFSNLISIWIIWIDISYVQWKTYLDLYVCHSDNRILP